MPAQYTTDLAIIGGGLAGLSLALRAADSGLSVLLIAKGRLSEGSSLYAQGGIAAALGAEDSFQSHSADTISAGGGLCHTDTVDLVIRKAPECIDWLVRRGVVFSRSSPDHEDSYHLTKEGGHSHRRVIHAADATGHAVETTLEQQTREHNGIQLLEDHIAIDLITSEKLTANRANRCFGLYILDVQNGTVHTVAAKFVALATGGASKAYLYTSNPDTSTGDGIAMAWRAGCRVANMEFVQFHPTCLYHPRAKSFLISEAVRGEGGILLLPTKQRFMPDHDERAELAPRDIVARAIDYEMKRGGFDSVLLDISHKSASFILSHFPTIHERCLEFGFDMTKGPIPVVPAAHYTCGGVVTNLAARTDIDGLYAIGETAFTGLHGANRLASNSLLECMVFADTAVQDIIGSEALASALRTDLPQWDESRVSDPDEQIVVSHNWDELRRSMWDYVGIVRTTKRLERAQHRIKLLADEIHEYYRNFRISNDLIELRNLVVVADLIVRCALAREESRGLHFTRDYPVANPEFAHTDTVLVPHPTGPTHH